MGIGLFLGLAVLCGLFFGLGYVVGHRSSQAALTALSDDGLKPKLATPDAAKPKPASTPDNHPGKAQASSGIAPDSGVGREPVASTSGQHAAMPRTQPADTAPDTLAPARQDDSTRAQGSSTGWMIQIAAVSQPEDAQMLEGALRKRGYGVVLSRGAADNMIHVRIGPFSSRDEAGQWRQKLLNDGYNAILQP